MLIRGIFLTFFAATSAVACSSASSEPAAPDCTPRWTVEKGSDAAAAVAGIADGKLALAIPKGVTNASTSGPALPLKVFQEGLSGDFDATFKVENFEGAPNSSAVVAFAVDANGDGAFAKLEHEENLFGVRAAVGGTNFVKATSGNSATFRFKRTGTKIQATATGPDGASTSVEGTVADIVRVGIGLNKGTENGEQGPSSVAVTDFTYTGAGIQSDSFVCATLK